MKSHSVAYSAVIVILIVLFFPVHSLAERPDMTWGVVSREHLTMDVYEHDTDAVAVVLFDYGKSVIAEDFYIDFKRHRRVKILSADGYNWGEHEVVYRASGRRQRVHDVEAHTINIDDEGNVTRHALDPNDIFDEDIDGSLRKIRFTLPALQPGSVVEFRYRVTSNSPVYLYNWGFQTSEPVLWSEYEAKIPNILHYVQVIEGTHGLHESDRQLYNERDPIFAGTHYRWVMKDLPAIRSEPFITTVSDYRTRLRFQLSSIRLPGRQPQRYLNTWADLIEELAMDRDFGRAVSGTRQIRREAREIVEGITDPVEKMKAIYRFVQTSIVWDGSYRVFGSARLNSVLADKSGNSADLGLLLTAMLRAVDIDADPVIISTRSNGRIQTLYPIVQQFNHVITRVRIGRNFYLLDATDPYIPVGLLPFQSMTDTGVLIKRDAGEWITIGSTLPTRRTIEAALHLAVDGAIAGNVTVEDIGYNAASRRRHLDNNPSEDYTREVLGEDHSLIEVDSFLVTNRENIEEPLLTTVYLSSSDYTSAVGEYVYLNPWIVGRMNENPLRLPERSFPVEMVYQRGTTISVTLTIPDNFEIVERPRPATLRLPRNGGLYRKRVQMSGNVLTFHREFELNQVTFEPNEYKELRDFFVQVVANDSEQLVLRRLYDEREVSGSQ